MDGGGGYSRLYYAFAVAAFIVRTYVVFWTS